MHGRYPTSGILQRVSRFARQLYMYPHPGVLYKINMIFKLVVIVIPLWTLLFSSVASQTSLTAVMYEPIYEKAKTDCGNCSLVVAKTGDAFQTNAIAVSFVVSVKIEPKNESSYIPLFRFVWVRDVRAKFLLGLPDDSEILSLTTLQHSVDVYDNIEMICPANQSQCFKFLSSECRVEVIVATFYNSNFEVLSGQPFCFPPANKNHSENNGVVNKCCSWNKKTGYINCTELIKPNEWVAYAIIAVQVGSAIMFILSPLLFKYLPTRDTQVVRKSRGTPRRTTSSTIPTMMVDSISPNRKLLTLSEPLSFVTCGGDEAQPCYSRLCRAIAIFVFPILFCVYVIVFFLNNHSAKIRTNVSYYTGLVGLLEPPGEYYLFIIVVFCIFLLGVLVLIPGRLSGIGKALSGRRDERTFFSFEKPEHLVNTHSGKIGFQFFHANMVFHLKCLFDLQFWLFILKVIFSPCECLLRSCCCKTRQQSELLPDAEQTSNPPVFCIALGVIFLPVVMPLWTTLVLIALLVYVTPIGYTAFRIGRLLFKKDVPFRCGCCERLPLCIRMILVVILYFLFISFCVLVLSSYIFVTFMFGVFFYILGKIFLFVLIGLVFNVNFYLPYAVAGCFVLFYIGLAFNHYLSVYENLRIVLFEECEKYEQQIANGGGSSTDTTNLSSQSAGTGLLLFLDYNNSPSIPVNLYVATYRRLRPRGKTFFTILTKLFLIFVYMSLTFASIMSLDKAQDTSTDVQAIFLCAMFVLPLVMHYAGRAHSKQRRKELEYQVRLIIHRYVAKITSSTDNSPNSTVDVEPGLFEI